MRTLNKAQKARGKRVRSSTPRYAKVNQRMASQIDLTKLLSKGTIPHLETDLHGVVNVEQNNFIHRRWLEE